MPWKQRHWQVRKQHDTISLVMIAMKKHVTHKA